MYVTYKGNTYIIAESFPQNGRDYYDLADPDGIKDTLFNVLKERCSEPRNLYDEDEWLEEQSEEEEEELDMHKAMYKK